MAEANESVSRGCGPALGQCLFESGRADRLGLRLGQLELGLAQARLGLVDESGLFGFEGFQAGNLVPRFGERLADQCHFRGGFLTGGVCLLIGLLAGQCPGEGTDFYTALSGRKVKQDETR